MEVLIDRGGTVVRNTSGDLTKLHHRAAVCFLAGFETAAWIDEHAFCTGRTIAVGGQFKFKSLYWPPFVQPLHVADEQIINKVLGLGFCSQNRL